MNTLDYIIDGRNISVSVENCPPFSFGDDIVISNQETDIVYGQDWYNEGHTSVPFLNEDEFSHLKKGISDVVKSLIETHLNLDTDGFTLENYHHFVKNSEDHYKIVSKTRDLFPPDFNFPIEEMLPRFGKILGFNLTNIDPLTSEELHIIIRINRPGSNDFNPPHKDIYEEYDDKLPISPFVNLWIPIAGVTEKSSLPIVPKSHHMSESEICRTFKGSVVEGNKYRVRMMKSWSGNNELVRAKVKDGEVLFFTSHLIHGLAKNEEEDLTRVALEFRLFKA